MKLFESKDLIMSLFLLNANCSEIVWLFIEVKKCASINPWVFLYQMSSLSMLS